MHPMLNIAIKASQAAGKVIVRYMDKLDSLRHFEKQANDFATEVDQQAEQEIIKIIRRAYPSHGILAEESGSHPGDDYQWIVDPLDGTTNYIHGFPHFAVSIGVTYRNKLETGVIFDPVRNEMFMASRGEGARLNDRRVRVSKRESLDGSLLGTGFHFKNPTAFKTYLDTFQALTPKAAGVRRAGAAALDLAYVAAGRLDGFWEFNLSAWDIAAGALLIKEAGGLISDLQGADDYLSSGNVLAGNPKIHASMLQALK